MTAADADGEQSSTGPMLVLYLFVLPDPLPIEHGSTWTRLLDEVEPLLVGRETRPLERLRPAQPSEASGC